jgi:hypothetical protein
MYYLLEICLLISQNTWYFEAKFLEYGPPIDI